MSEQTGKKRMDPAQEDAEAADIRTEIAAVEAKTTKQGAVFVEDADKLRDLQNRLTLKGLD